MTMDNDGTTIVVLCHSISLSRKVLYKSNDEGATWVLDDRVMPAGIGQEEGLAVLGDGSWLVGDNSDRAMYGDLLPEEYGTRP